MPRVCHADSGPSQSILPHCDKTFITNFAKALALNVLTETRFYMMNRPIGPKNIKCLLVINISNANYIERIYQYSLVTN